MPAQEVAGAIAWNDGLLSPQPLPPIDLRSPLVILRAELWRGESTVLL